MFIFKRIGKPHLFSLCGARVFPTSTTGIPLRARAHSKGVRFLLDATRGAKNILRYARKQGAIATQVPTGHARPAFLIGVSARSRALRHSATKGHALCTPARPLPQAGAVPRARCSRCLRLRLCARCALLYSLRTLCRRRSLPCSPAAPFFLLPLPRRGLALTCSRCSSVRAGRRVPRPRRVHKGARCAKWRAFPFGCCLLCPPFPPPLPQGARVRRVAFWGYVKQCANIYLTLCKPCVIIRNVGFAICKQLPPICPRGRGLVGRLSAVIPKKRHPFFGCLFFLLELHKTKYSFCIIARYVLKG